MVAEKGELSEQTLSCISNLDRYDGYSEAVARQLYQKKYKLDYVLLSVTQEYPLSFEDESVGECIRQNCSIIWDDYPKLFTKLRLRVAGAAGISLEKYSFLFGSNNPILTQKELNKIQERNADSDNLIMTLVPQVLVEEEHINMLAEYFCRRSQDNRTTFAILNYISDFASDVVKACFFELDFDKICYRHISADRRGKIKAAFFSALSLDTPEEKMAFMEQTKYLDPQWETELVSSMKDDPELYDYYITLVNQSSNIKNTTIQTICKFPVHPMTPVVNEKLFEAKKFTVYVSSKTAWGKRFTMETGERGVILWPIYLSMFRDSNWKRTREYMTENQDFIARIMRERAYNNMSHGVLCVW